MSDNDIKKIMRDSNLNNHLNTRGFGPAQPKSVSLDTDVIRGLEQVHIDMLGGSQSMGGTSSNAINSIAKSNPKREQYLEAAKQVLGERE